MMMPITLARHLISGENKASITKTLIFLFFIQHTFTASVQVDIIIFYRTVVILF